MDIPPYDDAADWIVTFRPVNSQFTAPAARRMARLLKSCLRCFGFRAIDYYQPHQKPYIDSAKKEAPCRAP
jgi:hypothetical protein